MRALLCGMLLAGMAFGAAPPATLTPEQVVANRQAFALFRQAQALWKAGKQAEAIASMEKAHRGVTAIYGQHDLVSHSVSNWLALWETQRGYLKEAAEHRERIWRTMATLRGEGHWMTVDARLALAETLAQQKRTPAQRAALARAAGLSRLEVPLLRTGQFAKAVPLAQQVLAIRKEVLGEKHPEYANSLHNLAFLYFSLGDHRAALPLNKQALAIWKEALGEKHPRYATGLNNLADLYRSMGNHKQALALFKQALSITKEVQGEKHPGYASSLNNLALLYKAMGGLQTGPGPVQEGVVHQEGSAGREAPRLRCLPEQPGLAALRDGGPQAGAAPVPAGIGHPQGSAR
jgi:tetratricopeptide (TPR) repeat protein